MNTSSKILFVVLITEQWKLTENLFHLVVQNGKRNQENRRFVENVI